MAVVLLGTPVTTFAEEVVGEVTLSADGKSVTGVTAPVGKEQKDITKVEIPASVTAIRKYAFYGCSSLTSIELPASVTSIGGGAFEGCSSLTSVSIPASVTVIGVAAFVGCSSLKSLIVDSDNTVYKSENNLLLSQDGTELVACPGGLSSVTIPASVTSIGAGAFRGCSSLESIDIPDSVTSIGAIAFVSCASLSSLDIPASVGAIGAFVFSGCSSLTSVTIPCDFDLKLFGWDEEDRFTGESGLLPASGFTDDYKPTNATTYKVHSPEDGAFFDAGTFTLSHDWDGGEITKDPTCTDKGEKKFTCARSGCEETKTEEVAIDEDAHDLSDVVVSEPTAEKLGVVHRVCSRCDYDVFSHYTLKDGTSPTMYPDGTRISDASYTPKAGGPFNLNGQEIEILLQDPLGVLGSGTLGLSVEQIELPADFDGDVDVEHAHAYEIVPTVDGVKVSGGLSNKVRLLYKTPQGWDRHDLEVFLAQAGEDREFDEVTEKIGNDEYLVVWTDHFSPYVFVDKLNPEEKAALEKLQNESGNADGNHFIKTGDASGEILVLSTLAMIATGLYLGLFLKKKKSF